MEKLKMEAEETGAKNEELGSKVKTLEQENMSKEQEITSLTHRNQLLEAEVEKLEGQNKDAKSAADEHSHHSTENEALQRRLQLLEDEAEQADKSLKETNEKYDIVMLLFILLTAILKAPPDRYQSRPLRAQGSSSRSRTRQLGEEVR